MIRPREGRQPASLTPLGLVYAALVSGVILFSAIAYVLAPTGADAEPISALRWAWLGVAVVAVLAMGVLRGRLKPGSDAGHVLTTAITVWALAEGVVLLGLVAWLATGDRALGIAALLVGGFFFFHHRPSTFR